MRIEEFTSALERAESIIDERDALAAEMRATGRSEAFADRISSLDSKITDLAASLFGQSEFWKESLGAKHDAEIRDALATYDRFEARFADSVILNRPSGTTPAK